MIDKSRPRFLDLETGHNVRDLGGYRASNGRTIKWQMLLRSGYMSRISEDDGAALRALGIHSIFDFRANRERESHPTRWHLNTPTKLWTRDHIHSVGKLDQSNPKHDRTKADMQDRMIDIYRALPFEQCESYRALFAQLARGNSPILFNCSAGKDRTGLAAALIMMLLGVSYEDILEDFLLSNQVIDGLIIYFQSTSRFSSLTQADQDRLMPIFRAEPEYLSAAFDAIMSQHGNIDTYMRDVLGVGEREQAAIKAQLLE